MLFGVVDTNLDFVEFVYVHCELQMSIDVRRPCVVLMQSSLVINNVCCVPFDICSVLL